MIGQVVCVTEQLTLPTYREPPAEQLPMFAENRVHQRSSGNPYPNRIVSDVDREHRENKTYTAIRLENEYLQLILLPELGGRIYSAYDKVNKYDFFYKQHVIKPAPDRHAWLLDFWRRRIQLALSPPSIYFHAYRLVYSAGAHGSGHRLDERA